MSYTDHVCLSAFEPCGCLAWVEVLGYGDDPGAYRTAAKHVKAGRVIHQETVAEWRKRGMHCTAHPNGPPWWKSNGGNGRRPADAETTGSLGP